MLLQLITAVSFVQFVAGVICIRRGWRSSPTFLFSAAFLSHLLVFPQMFFPPSELTGGCGMPALGIMLAFWIFGCGSSCLTYFLTCAVALWLRPHR